MYISYVYSAFLFTALLQEFVNLRPAERK